MILRPRVPWKVLTAGAVGAAMWALWFCDACGSECQPGLRHPETTTTPMTATTMPPFLDGYQGGVLSGIEAAYMLHTLMCMLVNQLPSIAILHNPHSSRPKFVRPFVERDPMTQVTTIYEGAVLLDDRVSRFQSAAVYETKFFGRLLVIDGETMLTERDEAHYHEMLAFVPLVSHGSASNVLIVGGGDGGTLSRVLQYGVKAATIVEIDPMVVELARKYFPRLSQSFDDDRVQLIHEDAAKWACDKAKQIGSPVFDVILIDSTDFGVARPLFTSKFYKCLRQLTAPKALVALNVDSPSWSLPVLSAVSVQLGSLFRYVRFYQVHQPTYGSGHYSFAIVSDTIDAMQAPATWEPPDDTKYYTPDVHRAAFALPRFVQRAVYKPSQLVVPV